MVKFGNLSPQPTIWNIDGYNGLIPTIPSLTCLSLKHRCREKVRRISDGLVYSHAMLFTDNWLGPKLRSGISVYAFVDPHRSLQFCIEIDGKYAHNLDSTVLYRTKTFALDNLESTIQKFLAADSHDRRLISP